MDSNNLTPLRKGVVGVQFLFVAFRSYGARAAFSGA